MARTLYNEPERFVETYWDRFGKDMYLVGDAARIDEDGYFWIVGRTDDVINVSGHRLSTMEVESALVSHESVAEAAVIGVPDEDTGQAIFAFVTPEGGATGGDRARGRSCATTSRTRSASSPAPSRWPSPTTCRRPAPGRSCAGCCVTSRPARSSATSPRCGIRRSSTGLQKQLK